MGNGWQTSVQVYEAASPLIGVRLGSSGNPDYSMSWKWFKQHLPESKKLRAPKRRMCKVRWGIWQIGLDVRMGGLDYKCLVWVIRL